LSSSLRQIGYETYKEAWRRKKEEEKFSKVEEEAAMTKIKRFWIPRREQ